MSRHTSKQVLISVSPGLIWSTSKYQNVRSPPYRSLLTYILVPRFKYHLHPCTASPPYMPKNSCLTSFCVASRIQTRSRRTCLTSIHFMSHINSGQENYISSPCYLISPYPGLRMCVSVQARSNLTPSRYRYLCLISIQLTFNTDWCRNSTQVPFHPKLKYWELHLTYIQVIYQLHPGDEMCISHPSISTLTSIKVLIFASYLHSGRISLAPRSRLNLI